MPGCQPCSASEDRTLHTDSAGICSRHMRSDLTLRASRPRGSNIDGEGSALAPNECCGLSQTVRRRAPDFTYRNSTRKTRRPGPCLATLRRSTSPTNPERRASSGLTSVSCISSNEVTTIRPGGMEYVPPTLTRGDCHSRTLQVISPFRTRSRNALANCTKNRVSATSQETRSSQPRPPSDSS